MASYRGVMLPNPRIWYQGTQITQSRQWSVWVRVLEVRGSPMEIWSGCGVRDMRDSPWAQIARYRAAWGRRFRMGSDGVRDPIAASDINNLAMRNTALGRRILVSCSTIVLSVVLWSMACMQLCRKLLELVQTWYKTFLQ